jgi:hypothetical protein
LKQVKPSEEDLRLALKECRETLQAWHHSIQRLHILVADFENYTWDAFTISIGERLPALDRTEKAALARLSILLQWINGGISPE